jgi:hypothetical protein
LIAYYPFNGNANDESGNGNHGENYGPILTEDMFGNPDNAYNFDGMDDHIRVPDSDSLNVSDGITIAAWINIPLTGNYGRYIVDSREGYEEPGYYLFVGTEVVGFGVPRGPGGFGIDISPSEWHHIAGTYDGVTMIIYLDGVEVGNVLVATPFTQSNAMLMIGRCYPGGGGYMFNGIMDELRIYNRALAASEIEELLIETGPPCDADYNDDGFVDKKDRIKKRRDLMTEAREEYRDWFQNCWRPEHGE